MAAASIGTETDGSITCPAAINGIVGLKPTLGLLPTERTVPVSHSPDAPGPMGRAVTDVAILLDAIVEDARGRYLKALQGSSLRGKRIGVLRFEAGRRPDVELAYAAALKRIQAAGASLIEVSTPDETRIDAYEQTVLLHEFKTDLRAYLASAPAAVGTRSLVQLIAFNQNTPKETPWFGQELFLQSQATPGTTDLTYRNALLEAKRLAGEQGLRETRIHNHLDFLVAPTTGAAWRIDTVAGDNFPGSFSTLPAVAGYPHLTVPMGRFRQLPLGLGRLLFRRSTVPERTNASGRRWLVLETQQPVGFADAALRRGAKTERLEVVLKITAGGPALRVVLVLRRWCAIALGILFVRDQSGLLERSTDNGFTASPLASRGNSARRHTGPQNNDASAGFPPDLDSEELDLVRDVLQEPCVEVGLVSVRPIVAHATEKPALRLFLDCLAVPAQCHVLNLRRTLRQD